MDNIAKKKYIYLLVGCIVLIILIIDATFAYFSASASDDSTVYGNTEAVSFSLFVDRVSTVDMVFGLIPMLDDMAPFAASNGCLDDNNKPVCQIYKITVKANSSTVMFLDGYITMETKQDVDVSFTRVEVVDDDNDEEVSNLKFKTPDDFDVDSMVKNGVKNSSDELFDIEEDVNCMIVQNDKFGGDSVDDFTNVYYVMVWLRDTGINQDSIQGLEYAYKGTVTFVTADGNEISATFD